MEKKNREREEGVVQALITADCFWEMSGGLGKMAEHRYY